MIIRQQIIIFQRHKKTTKILSIHSPSFHHLHWAQRSIWTQVWVTPIGRYSPQFEPSIWKSQWSIRDGEVVFSWNWRVELVEELGANHHFPTQVRTEKMYVGRQKRGEREERKNIPFKPTHNFILSLKEKIPKRKGSEPRLLRGTQRLKPDSIIHIQRRKYHSTQTRQKLKTQIHFQHKIHEMTLCSHLDTRQGNN